MIQGISHITFVVSDLDKTATLLTKIFDAKEVYSSGDKTFSVAREKFFLANGLWIAIMEGPALPEKTYNHVALQVKEEDLEEICSRVRDLGLEVKDARSRVEGEGQSFYFYDYDNHLFELHTGTLEQRLQTYSRTQSHD